MNDSAPAKSARLADGAPRHQALWRRLLASTTGGRLRISLFWRTFILLAALVGASLATLVVLLRVIDSAPPEQRLAWEVASIVNLTRSALVSSQPERRITLLRELANEEGIRVLPLEPADRVEMPELTDWLALLSPRVQNLLGPKTLVASKVNDQDGLWVSFAIDDDHYWVQMQRRRIERHFGPNLGLVVALAAGLALVGALALSRTLNRPLADLARAISTLRRGAQPEPLREDLVSEIALVNRRFNAMAADLTELERDRALTLAGISHDIRSPLARMRMEAELAPLDPGTRDSIIEDIERIDAIVDRFVDFARAGTAGAATEVQISPLLSQLGQVYRAQAQSGELRLAVRCPSRTSWLGDRTDLERVLSNLIDNALRYGKVPEGLPHAGHTLIQIESRRLSDGLRLVIRDHGPGVPTDQLQRLIRPFARLDSARGVSEGSGLGLAIVERIVRRYDGSFVLRNAEDGRRGLVAIVTLPDARDDAGQPFEAGDTE
ncbi:MAG: ATP-binding protein [Burkholderiaceae bacterium]